MSKYSLFLDNCNDGDDCKDDFVITENELPLEWLCQDSEEGVRMLLHTLVCDGIPMEGGTSPDGHCHLSFFSEIGGFGFTMTYEYGKENEFGFAPVKVTHIFRNSTYDRAPDQTFVPFEVKYGIEV